MITSRTLEQTTQDVLDFASKQFSMPPGTLAPDDAFFKKLGIDSLQALELLTRLEDHFCVELPVYELRAVNSFGALVKRIQIRLESGKSVSEPPE